MDMGKEIDSVILIANFFRVFTFGSAFGSFFGTWRAVTQSAANHHNEGISYIPPWTLPFAWRGLACGAIWR